MTYAIFKVCDYKGGELSSSTNLSKEVFIRKLSTFFENEDFEDEDGEPLKKDLESIKSFINECISKEDFESEYAGGDGFCGEFYEVDGDKMKSVYFGSFLEEIAQYIFENWFEC